MAKGYSGKVLVAVERGGYKYVSVGSVDRKRFKSVRRIVKIGRGKPRRRRFWTLKKTRPVEYVRQFIFREEDGPSGEYSTEDVVEVVDEPEDITDQEMAFNLTDPSRLKRMQRYLMDKHEEDIGYSNPLELSSGKGGARRLTTGQAKGVVRGLRLEDLRRIGG